jgi:hypothetical protein
VAHPLGGGQPREGFKFKQVVREVEGHLDGRSGTAVLVEAINVRLQLTAIANYLLTALFEGDLHVYAGRSANVTPKDSLFHTGGVLCPNRRPLRIDYVLLTHGLSQGFGTLADQ